MKTAKIDFPLGVFACLIPILAGVALAGEGRWTPAIVLFVLGGAWQIGGTLLFARRAAALRRSGGLTSHDILEIEYPGWVRRGVSGYVFLLAATTGILILATVVYFVVAVARK